MQPRLDTFLVITTQSALLTRPGGERGCCWPPWDARRPRREVSAVLRQTNSTLEQTVFLASLWTFSSYAVYVYLAPWQFPVSCHHVDLSKESSSLLKFSSSGLRVLRLDLSTPTSSLFCFTPESRIHYPSHRTEFILHFPTTKLTCHLTAFQVLFSSRFATAQGTS